MKKISFLLVFVSFVGLAYCAEPSAYKLESSSSSEIFSTKVLKVYQAETDSGSYFAYVVDWRGQEVVVTPTSFGAPQAPLKVGDTVRCAMRSSPVTPGTNKKAYLSFSIMTTPDPERLEAVLSEIRERHEKREATLKDSANTTGAAEVKKP